MIQVYKHNDKAIVIKYDIKLVQGKIKRYIINRQDVELNNLLTYLSISGINKSDAQYGVELLTAYAKELNYGNQGRLVYGL